MSEHAHGRFEVTLTPQEPDGSGIGRFALEKTWHGDLEGRSTGLMLSGGDPATGRAGYVALEVVEGALHGRAGGFAFQQLGVMRPEGQELQYAVVPGSGTGELIGLEGTLDLVIDDDGTHTYDLAYTVDEGSAAP